MNHLFIFSLLLLVYIYIGYILVLILLSLFYTKKVDKNNICPTVTLLIPAYNEEGIIEQKILNSLDLDYPVDKLEIIIASESDDKTNEIVRQFEDKGVILQAYAEREGKCANLYKTVPMAQGEIIVFSDANAMFEKDAIKKLVRNFHDPRIGCVSGQLRFYEKNRSSVGAGEGFYWKYEMMIKKLESKLFSLLGCNGSIFAIRKPLYLPIDKYRGDDFDLALRIAQRGYGVILESEAVSWEKASNNITQELGRKVRIVSWFIASSRILIKEFINNKKWFLLFQIISHKVLRWIAPIFLIVLFLSNLLMERNSFAEILLISQLILYILAIVGYLIDHNGIRVPKYIMIPYYFCIVNCFALLGILRYLAHDQHPTWEKMRE